jgi:O-antigen/teichoic acid export membrane protein
VPSRLPPGDNLTVTGSLIAKNTVFSLVSQIAPLITAIVAIPVLVDRLGLSRLGVLSLVWVVLGYAGVLDLGIARALTQRTSQLLARGEPDKIPDLATSALFANVLLGAVGGACLLILAAPLAHALAVPADLLDETADSFSVLALGLPVALATAAVRGLIEGAQRFDLVTAIAAPSSAFTYVLPAVGALLGLSLPAIVALLVAGRVATLAAYFLLTRRAIPKRSVYGLPRWGAARSLLGYGGWLTVSSASAPAIVYGERTIIAAATTASGLALYVIPYELVARLWVIPGALAATLFPAFSALNEVGSDRIGSTFRQSLTLLMVLVGAPAIVLVAVGGPLLSGWLGSDVASSATAPLQIFAVGAVVNSLGYLPLAFLQASGRAHVAAKVHLAEIPATYLVTWILALQFGVIGAAIAWLGRVALDAGLLFILAGRASRDVALGARAAASAAIIIGLAVLGGALSSTIELLPVRFLVMTLIVCVTLALTWRLSLTSADRTSIASLAQRWRSS